MIITDNQDGTVTYSQALLLTKTEGLEKRLSKMPELLSFCVNRSMLEYTVKKEEYSHHIVGLVGVHIQGSVAEYYQQEAFKRNVLI